MTGRTFLLDKPCENPIMAQTVSGVMTLETIATGSLIQAKGQEDTNERQTGRWAYPAGVPLWSPHPPTPAQREGLRSQTWMEIQAEPQNLCESMQVMWLKASWMTEKHFYMTTQIHAGEARGSPRGPQALLLAAAFLGCDRCLPLDCDANSHTNYKGEWLHQR